MLQHKKTNAPKAVALQYDPGKADAPFVTATGEGEIAEKILEIAFKEGVNIREDKNLVELLGAVDVGTEIPIEAFAAVAEILTYLYTEDELKAKIEQARE